MPHLSLDAMLDDALRLLACESPSSDLEAVALSADLTAEVLGARFGAAGLPATPERMVIDGVTHLRWRFAGPTRVLLLGHHDTVWPHGSLATHPAKVADGVLTGPGCFDMVIGLVQAAHAVAALASSDGAHAVAGVTFLVTGDEEVGSLTSRALIEEEAARADAVLVLEAAGPDGALKTERKGTSMYTVQVRGRAAHAGLEPEAGVNAAIELAYQIHAIAALGDPALGTTVTPTSGRIGSTLNTVPASAAIDVDVRATSAAELERVDAAMRSLTVQLPGASLSIDGGINRPPLERRHSQALYERAARLAPTVGVVGLTECAVGGASDGNFTAGIGVATLDGLGGVGGGAHADDEHVLVDHIVPRTALLAALVRDLLTSPA